MVDDSICQAPISSTVFCGGSGVLSSLLPQDEIIVARATNAPNKNFFICVSIFSLRAQNYKINLSSPKNRHNTPPPSPSQPLQNLLRPPIAHHIPLFPSLHSSFEGSQRQLGMCKGGGFLRFSVATFPL